MRPVSGESDGPAPERVSRALAVSGPVSSSEMSSLQSLGPVQSWLGQELEKCGIDAMIYTRYVLSLLLHDSYDYDLQEQENDIFLGWEKGAGKKWGKSKRKGGTDLSLEEMKKQAAVQCLRLASDENSGIENLVEELCSRLKDIQNKQKEKEKQGNKKSDTSQSPEPEESTSSKDQVEMYYEAFPSLSEKPVCLQEIMTVWNKAKACSYSSSSSSAVPQTSTDTSSPKDCTSESEAFRDRTLDAPSSTTYEKPQQRRTKREKENRFHGSATVVPDDQVAPQFKRQARHRSEGRFRLRSWSSGSSEAGSSSSGNQGDQTSSCKAVHIRHKSREVSSRNKRVRKNKQNSGQVKLALKFIDKDERKNARGSISTTGGPSKQQQHYMKKGKRPLREIRKDANLVEAQDSGGEVSKKEYMEEPLWYTEPISEYFVPLSRSKLETKYRSKEDSPNDLAMSFDVDCLSERIQGICISNSCFQRAYLAAGTFVDGHFIEVPGEGDEEATELNGITSYPPPEDGQDLDDKHLSEFTHFYEVDFYQSILDPSASDAVQESRILNMIRQKSIERKHFEADCVDLDGLELQGERVDSLGASEADVSLTQDMENIAQVWECCSSSSLEDLEGESCTGDSPLRLSPALDNVPFNFSKVSGAFVGPHLQEASSSISALNSCFSLFELQYDSPTFSFSCDSLTGGQDNIDSSSCLDPQGNKQSRLLIWTKNSAFDETEHCSNLSTRTCSPWSHSEETRSDSEQISAPADESAQFGNEEVSCIPLIPPTYLEEELLGFLQENSSHQSEETSVGTDSNQAFKKKSKLESVCGIALEQDESKLYNAVVFSDVPNHQSDEYTSGIIKDIWMAIGDGDCVLTLGVKNTGEHLFSEEATAYQCSCLDKDIKGEIIQRKAVQRSEYHLWDGQKKDEGLPKNKLSKIDDGDYTTPAKPWNCNAQDSTSFILGGVYGELKTLSGDREWAMIPPGEACGSLLQCATSSDMVTIAGADVFMNTSSCFAPGHKPLWRPLVSLGQNEHTNRGPGDGLNKGFSVFFHEDLLGSRGGFRGEEPGLDYPFSSFDLNNPFSQVLHVECSFEPEDMASFSPGFKPKSILCSDSDNEPFCPWLYGINRTQYRAIRISPRTHFRPISASELSPGGCSESDVESEKEVSLPAGHTERFDDPQADLKPLEDDAECEGPYYGKSELESGKFLPSLKKSGMEKSAQTSLDSQEGGSTLLPIAEQEICIHCETAAVSALCSHVHPSVLQQEESYRETESCQYVATDQIPKIGKSLDVVQDMDEFTLLNFGEQCLSNIQQEECWWQSTLCSPLFPDS
ncbi:uncharacterized protein KIAA0232 homolog [Xyrauchen texanus]|uniref:uncharacterized protein KIAA0232 homolog n=1 Tax=Xyrauchen texanus TaxID=154827 RepID=UPI002241C071|nr:uncharacterized protein KIAA0232 homolog [Xyrauchen texanus]